MRFTSTSNLRLLTLAWISTALCLSGTASGQGVGNQRTDTSTADNPALRSHDEPSKTKSKIVKVSDKDAQFISRAMTGGEQEVENGKMALKRGQSAEVKKVASRMVQDHTKANNELLVLAKKKGVGVPTGTVKAQNISEKGFDKQYLDMLEQDHKAAIAEFEKQARNGDDQDLKNWATKTLPTLRGHFAMVRDALKQVK